MRILHIGDMHGRFDILERALESSFDVAVSTGDLFPDFSAFPGRGTKRAYTAAAFQETLLGELDSIFSCALKNRPLLYVGGNHDYTDVVLGYDKVYHLTSHTEPITINDVTFWGFEEIPEHTQCWNHETSPQELSALVSSIPKVDVLVTHAPPYGILDEVPRRDGSICHCGIPGLSEKVLELGIKAHLFGHIHEAEGTQLEGNTMFSNADCGYHLINVEG